MPKGTRFSSRSWTRRWAWARHPVGQDQNHQFITRITRDPELGGRARKDRGSPHINNSALFLPRISSTFHGRDIMAPVAAAIAKGLPERASAPYCGTTGDFPPPEKTGTGHRPGHSDRPFRQRHHQHHPAISHREVYLRVADRLVKGPSLPTPRAGRAAGPIGSSASGVLHGAAISPGLSA